MPNASLTSLVSLSLALLLGASLGCAAMRQNLRGQELSYRGAWFCEQADCKPEQMVISRAGTREGTTDIASVSLRPKAALAFTAAAAFDSLEATVRDCEGHSAKVPEGSITPAGKHEVGDSSARESWIVWIDPGELAGLERGAGKCARWMIDAKATWSDGATFAMTVGIEAER